MSGIKSMDLTRFHRRLHSRGLTIEGVADQIFSSRSHVSQVLSGARPGAYTWRKLARVLTADELAMLGRGTDGRPAPDFPRGALSHVERVEQGAPA